MHFEVKISLTVTFHFFSNWKKKRGGLGMDYFFTSPFVNCVVKIGLKGQFLQKNKKIIWIKKFF